MTASSTPNTSSWQEPDPTEAVSHTYAKIQIGDETVRYRTAAGTYLLTEDNGRPRAQLFYVAYTRLGETDPASRPVAFCFNGGPGSSSVWLHMGCLGPRKVDMMDGLEAPRPPFRLVDNAWSLLDAADLVFIDPVSTGYSRPAPETAAQEFHGVEPDVESVGDFIRLWTSSGFGLPVKSAGPHPNSSLEKATARRGLPSWAGICRKSWACISMAWP